MDGDRAIIQYTGLLTEMPYVPNEKTDGFQPATENIHSALCRLEDVYDTMMTEREEIDQIRKILNDLMKAVSSMQFKKESPPPVADDQAPESQIFQVVQEIQYAKTSLEVNATAVNKLRLERVKAALGIAQLTQTEIDQVTQNLQAHLANQT